MLINSFGSYRYVAARLAEDRIERQLREKEQSEAAQEYVTFNEAYLQCQRQQMDKMLNDALQAAENEAKEQAEKQQNKAKKEKDDSASKQDSGTDTDTDTGTDTDTNEENKNSFTHHKKRKKHRPLIK